MIINIINYLLLFILLLGTIWQDFWVANYIGEIGRTPIFLFLPIFLLYEILNYRFSIKFSKLEKYLFLFIIYILFISFIYDIIYFIFNQNSLYLLGENLWIKKLKAIFYLILCLFYMRFSRKLFLKINDYYYLFIIFQIIYYLLFIIYLLESYFIPNSLLMLHSSNDPYFRIRLLTSENSSCGSIMFIFYFITKYLSYKIKINYLLNYLNDFIFILFLFYNFSKGFVVSILISIFVVSIFNLINKKNIIFKFKILGLILFLFLIVYSYFFNILYIAFMRDFTSYTSTITRSCSMLAAFYIFISNPFGIGTGVYIPYLLAAFTYLLNNITFLGNFNLSEIYDFYGTQSGLIPKSYFFQHLMYGGLGFIIFLLYFLKKIILYLKKDLLNFNLKLMQQVLFSYILISLTFHLVIDVKYEFWLYFAFVDFINYKNENGDLI